MAEIKKYEVLGVSDFARRWGISPKEMPKGCVALIARGDFRYRRLDKNERDAAILKILKQLDTYDNVKKSIAGGDGRKRWMREWKSVFEAFVAGGYDTERLVPPYFRPQIVRLDGDFAMPASPRFSINAYTVLRRWIIETYFKKAHAIYEFGCGTGFNVAEIARLCSDAEVHGLDWTPYSARIIQAFSHQFGHRAHGYVFDMLRPDKKFHLSPSAAVLTVGAMEQLNTRFEPFLRYIIRQKPALVVHIEPIVELADTNELFDFLAVSFNERRRYLTGFLPRLRALEKSGKIKIIKTQNTGIGSLYHDSYSLIVWKPV
ncbi:MAG: class I SAM-dependent methyltransferase [bacterium]|nr:class I SAM-dependent methyltransferase [bacterium]